MRADGEDRINQGLMAHVGIETTSKATRRHILIAKEQRQTKRGGILIAEESQRRTIKTTDIHVKTMWRRLSIGHGLLERLEDDCKAKGVTTITATFDQANHAMNALTKSRCGWSEAERPNAYTSSRRSAMEPVLWQLEQTARDRKLRQRCRHPLADRLLCHAYRQRSNEYFTAKRLALGTRQHGQLIDQERQIN